MLTNRIRQDAVISVVLPTVLLVCSLTGYAQPPQSPEEFLGHKVGADYKLAHWDRIVDYFYHLGGRSDRVNVRELGTTSDGRPMILAEISDAPTLVNLAPHRENQRKIADPRLIGSQEEERRLINESKVVILVSCQLHATEAAASQMAMELAYDLATDDTPKTREILEHTIILLVPCANPDGQQMVAEWYDKTLGKPWEGAGMPWLYQKYAGHDNNRDWFMLNLRETRLLTEIFYDEWFPTVVWDVHQTRKEGARLFVPPFHDPKNPNIHPIIDQTLLMVGGHMSAELARQGKKGVVHSAVYDSWWAGGFRTTPYRHNMIGVLTEAASVNVASPVFQQKSDLRGGRRGMPTYDMTVNFPDPWPGGWWRLRDIIDYEKVAGMSLFTLAARYHDMFQSNCIHIARESIERGRSEPPFAWLVPPEQRDPGSTYEMLERLWATGIEVHQAEEVFTADGVTYPQGTYVFYCAQPYRPHLMDMMERQVYPDRVQYPGGPPEQPYDMAGWTFPLQMGVRAVAVRLLFECDARKLESIPFPQGQIRGESEADYFLVRAGFNDDYRLVSRLHKAGIPFRIYVGGADWALDSGQEVPPGSLVISADETVRQKLPGLLQGISTDLTGLAKLDDVVESALQEAVQPRAALYQPWTASIDEGWMRLVLDNFEIDYVTIHNAELKAGALGHRYDCIVLPSLPVKTLLEGRAPDTTFPEYVGGIGREGVVALQDFVQDGGTLVCVDASCNLPIEQFNIPVRNILSGKKAEEFYCPGSLLRLSMDTGHPVGYGMPPWYSGYFAQSQAFELVPEPKKEDKEKEDEETARSPAKRFPSTVVSRYSDTVLLESGWIRGEKLITDKPAIVEVQYGKGRIDLLGFRVHYRGQSHGTFRILFNAIQRSTLETPAEEPVPEDEGGTSARCS